ncbi:MAG TPA: glycosyltransferase family 4 protein [Herpetosiphonaceae bacterium]
MRFGVAMISSVFYPSIGGAQTHTLRLSQKLKARGVDVLVITRHYEGLARYEEIDGIPTYRVGKGEGNLIVAALSYIVGALRVLLAQRNRYHILHCHLMISPMTIGLLAKPLVRKPLVINPHRSGKIGDVGFLTHNRPITGRLRLALARRWGDAFVSISRDIHDELAGIGVGDNKLWDIANGVDVDHFAPVTAAERAELRESLDLPLGPLVVFTGRLVTEKGVNVLIDAWPRVLRAQPDAKLLLVGDGDQREELEAQARQLGIAEQVIFAGGCADVAPYLRAADAFVLPSFAEGLPIALLEAMACGLPSVATAIGGTMRVLTDDVHGRLVPVSDPTALAQGLIEALGPSGQTWGEQARQHVVAQYSLDVVADRYMEMYETIQPKLKRPQAANQTQQA